MTLKASTYLRYVLTKCKAGNTRGVFVTIVFSADRFFYRPNSSDGVFLFLLSHMAAKLPIVYFGAIGSIV